MIKNVSNRMVQLSNHLIYAQGISKTLNNIDLVSNNNGLLKVTLNKPKALNALNLQMIQDLASSLSLIQQHKAFWIQGAGGKAFCAGGDVKRLYDAKILENNPTQANIFFRNQFTLDYRLSQLKSLEIANWDGIVMGGGVGISAFSPYRIATQFSMYAMPEAKLGFFTDVGAGYFLSRLRNNIGYYLGMTGARLKGSQVYTAGLANYFIPRQLLPKVYEELNSNISQSENPKQTINTILGKYHKQPQQKKLKDEDKITQIFGSKSVKQIYEKLSSGSSQFQKSSFKLLAEQCPFSVHVVFNSIEKSKSRTIKECFIQDYALTEHFVKENDFFEGIRCVLVNKGDTPKWKHKNILDVKPSEVQQFFKINESTKLEI